MAKLKRSVITNKGFEAIRKSIARSKKVNFTRLVSSDTVYNDSTDIATLTSINGVKQSISISEVKEIENNKIKVTGVFKNTELNTGYSMNTIALYGNVEGETEILFSVTRAEIADYMPATNGINVSTITIEIVLILSESANISVTLDTSALVTTGMLNGVKNNIDAELNKRVKFTDLATADTAGIVTENRIKELGGVHVGTILAFPKEITNPQGFLKCDGTNFNKEVYPDLFEVLGKNTLPKLNRTDVGMLAFFPQNNIPDGWLECNGQTIREADYPELFRYLGNKYGANGQLPNAENRFIRNAGNGLAVGQKQEDAYRSHNHFLANNQLGGRGIATSNLTSSTYLAAYTNDGTYEKYGLHRSLNNAPANVGLTSNSGGDETRPKSIVFKLCIKAKNTFDDVNYYIKAFGTVANVGEIDISRLAQDVHSMGIDLNSKLNNDSISYRKIGDFEIRKFPDGTMILTYIKDFSTGLETQFLTAELILPESFLESSPVTYTGTASKKINNSEITELRATGTDLANAIVSVYPVTNGKIMVQMFDTDQHSNTTTAITVNLIAIGKWK